MKVLIIDDDELQRMFLKTVLTKRFDAVVIEAKNGIEGLRMLEKGAPDVIMLDLWMPILNGHDFLEKIRADHRWRNIPVIIMSAIRDKEMVEKLVKLKISDYLLKPLTVDQISERMTKLLLPTSAEA